jgi:hypothetical protein
VGLSSWGFAGKNGYKEACWVSLVITKQQTSSYIYHTFSTNPSDTILLACCTALLPLHGHTAGLQTYNVFGWSTESMLRYLECQEQASHSHRGPRLSSSHATPIGA